MLKIGITGGIGSGKSTVAKVFKCLGIPVFDADSEAKLLYDKNDQLKHIIQTEFGNDIYPNGKFDRAKLASIVFNSDEKIKKLNSIIHPMVLDEFHFWCEKQTSPYVLKEAALLIEAKSYLDLQDIILVSAPLEIRIQRVIKRDQLKRLDVMNRIEKQMPEEEKKSYCRYEILNDDEHLLIPQVEALHQKILEEI